MNQIELSTESPFDALRRNDSDGEYWSARDLMGPLGYSRWQNFADAIDRARASAHAAGMDASRTFVQVAQLTGAGNLGQNSRNDVRMTRHGAYLVAMNADARKTQVALAQQYFAIKTREAEASVSAAVKAVEPTRRELALMVIEAEDARDRAEVALQEAKPAAEAWEVLASARGDYSVADAAKMLSRDPIIVIGQGRLFKLLESWRWIYRSADRRPRVMQTAVDTGRMNEIPRTRVDQETGERVIAPPQVRITAKGLKDIRRRIHEAAQIKALLA